MNLGFFGVGSTPCVALLIVGCSSGSAQLVGRAASTGGTTATTVGSTGPVTNIGTSAGASSGGASTSSGGGSTSSGGGSSSTGGTATTGGTTSGVVVIGSACDPNEPYLTCEPVGLYCRPDNPPDGGRATAGTCQVPIPPYKCLPTVGCAGDAGCANLGADGQRCVYLCNVTVDCPAFPIWVCRTGYVSATQGGCVLDWCTTPFASCDAQGTADGTCYGGLCYQSGSVANYQSCSVDRVDGGTDSLCVGGSTCVSSNDLYSHAFDSRSSGTCYTACAPSTGTVGCENGFMCWDLDLDNDIGACVPTCTTTTCPTPLTCQSIDHKMLCAP